MKHLTYIPLFLLLTLASCRGVKYIPVETVRQDTVYRNQVQRDSIYRRDSIHIHQRGDTVHVEKYRYLFVDKLKRDTLYIHRTDTIPVTVQVDKPLTPWQQMQMQAGRLALALLVLAPAVAVLRRGIKPRA